MASVALLLGGLVAAFAFAGGWLTPSRLSGETFVDTFEKTPGPHQGFRRNHAKGVGVRGTFESNGAGAEWSKAAVFAPGTTPVLGRISLAGPMPYQPDAPGAVRSLALQLITPDGQEWRTGMINLPVFPFNTPAAFQEQLAAGIPDKATGKPDPAKMTAFFARHPESLKAIGLIKAAAGTTPAATGFHDTTYHALNAFLFVNSNGKKTPVRWTMVPVGPFAPPPLATSATTQPNGGTKADTKNALFDDLIARLHTAPLKWKVTITLAEPEDDTRDASIPWPSTRRQVDVGTLTLDTIEAEAESVARDINFDPLVLPTGILPSEDPILNARSAAYAQSFTRRAGEKKLASAVTPDEVHP